MKPLLSSHWPSLAQPMHDSSWSMQTTEHTCGRLPGSARAHGPFITAGSTSAAPQLHRGQHLGCTSATPRLHLGYTSAAPRLYLGYTSALSRTSHESGHSFITASGLLTHSPACPHPPQRQGPPRARRGGANRSLASPRRLPSAPSLGCVSRLRLSAASRLRPDGALRRVAVGALDALAHPARERALLRGGGQGREARSGGEGASPRPASGGGLAPCT